MAFIECPNCKTRVFSSEERLVKLGWRKINNSWICPRCLTGRVSSWIEEREDDKDRRVENKV